MWRAKLSLEKSCRLSISCQTIILYLSNIQSIVASTQPASTGAVRSSSLSCTQLVIQDSRFICN